MNLNKKVTTNAKNFLCVDSLLIKKINKLRPKEIYLVKNEKRFNEAIQTINEFVKLMKSNDNEFTYTIELDKLLGLSLVFNVVTDFLGIINVREFSNLLNIANSFDIMAHTNGKFSIGFAFDNVYLPAPPYNK